MSLPLFVYEVPAYCCDLIMRLQHSGMVLATKKQQGLGGRAIRTTD
jgi:hypothetical protein